jgi:ATP phosphoribosyltransferase regulatory subunit
MNFLTISDELKFVRSRNKLKSELQKLFLKADYLEVEPSFLEDYEQFSKVNKRVESASMVKVLNGNGTVSILRPDMTSVIIKNFIPKWEVGTKLKFFYLSTVFENNSNGGINEWKQAGVEYLGEESQLADRNILKLSLSILSSYEENFLFELGSNKFLNGLLKELSLEEAEEQKLKEFLYHKDSFGLKQFLESIQLDTKFKGMICELLTLQGELDDICQKLENFFLNEEMKEAINELKELQAFLNELGYSNRTIFDLAMVTNFDYYDGIIFRGYYPTVFQPIISGGRYDRLTEKFGQCIPAVGFKVDFTSLLTALNRKEDRFV